MCEGTHTYTQREYVTATTHTTVPTESECSLLQRGTASVRETKQNECHTQSTVWTLHDDDDVMCDERGGIGVCGMWYIVKINNTKERAYVPLFCFGNAEKT